MKTVTIGISDCKVSHDVDSVLVTYALGSCIAVALYDPISRAGGLLHFMLPESKLDRDKAAQNPFMFADTGIPLLLRALETVGGNARRMVVRLAGGARVMDSQGVFEIGKRNYLAARRILWKAGVMIRAEAVGGNVSRTTRLELATGRMWVREGGAMERELSESGGSILQCPGEE
jgi:chemotaxis protein CheD